MAKAKKSAPKTKVTKRETVLKPIEQLDQVVDQVPVEAPPSAEADVMSQVEDLLDDKPPVDIEKIPEGIKKNVKGKQAALDALSLLREELKGETNKRFWEIIRDEAIKEAGMPVTPIDGKPMNNARSKAFLKEKFPRGRYMGKTVAHALKVEPHYLVKFANAPDWFQKKLMSFLARKENKDLLKEKAK